MPEIGRYEKVPRPESINTFIEYLGNNTAVTNVERESPQIIRVLRLPHSVLRVFMTNVYVVSLADVQEIISAAGKVNAIVTMSAWNGYTNEAKRQCKEMRIGLFTFREFLGAVHYNGLRFLNYILPEARDDRADIE